MKVELNRKPGSEKPRRRNQRTLKMVRRIHLYSGLLLLPWVIFFGFSGMLFNHPEWFGPVEIHTVKSAEEVDRIRVFEELDGDAIANEVVARLNEGSESTAYRLGKSRATIEGTLSFQGITKEGERVAVLISPNHGGASVRRFLNKSPQDTAPFANQKVGIDGFDQEGIAILATELVEEAGLSIIGPMEKAERGNSEVCFQLETIADGRLWNVVYQLADGSVSARPAEDGHGLDFYSMVSRLHKTHHYPDRFGARWAWSAFADATGITMVFWGLSGLIMWWQMKPTRVLGVVGISIATVLALLVFTGTFRGLTFGPTQTRGPATAGGTDRSSPQRSESKNPSQGKPGLGQSRPVIQTSEFKS